MLERKNKPNHMCEKVGQGVETCEFVLLFGEYDGSMFLMCLNA